MQTAERHAIVDRTVVRWAEIERSVMPSFFQGKEQLDAYDLYRHAIDILRHASFLTPHYMHGWAVGVEGRRWTPEKTLDFDNEFGIGYITGWCQMDEAMKRENME